MAAVGAQRHGGEAQQAEENPEKAHGGRLGEVCPSRLPPVSRGRLLPVIPCGDSLRRHRASTERNQDRTIASTYKDAIGS
jgi:hypothetical protein